MSNRAFSNIENVRCLSQQLELLDDVRSKYTVVRYNVSMHWACPRVVSD